VNRKTALLLRRDELLEQLPPLGEIVRGSLLERHLRCGKPTCRCARGEGHRVFYLAVSFARGRTEQITVPADLVPYVRQWLENYRRCRERLEEISAINRELLRKRWLPEGPAKRRRR
jgi:hypothetical protein